MSLTVIPSFLCNGALEIKGITLNI